MSEEPIVKTGMVGTEHVLVFEDRYEVHKPRALTMGLSSKKEIYPFTTIRDVTSRGANLTVHFGPMSVRNYHIGRKNVEIFLNAYRTFMASR